MLRRWQLLGARLEHDLGQVHVSTCVMPPVAQTRLIYTSSSLPTCRLSLKMSWTVRHGAEPQSSTCSSCAGARCLSPASTIVRAPWRSIRSRRWQPALALALFTKPCKQIQTSQQTRPRGSRPPIHTEQLGHAKTIRLARMHDELRNHVGHCVVLNTSWGIRVLRYCRPIYESLVARLPYNDCRLRAAAAN